MPANEHTQHMNDAHYKLTFGLPYYTCAVHVCCTRVLYTCAVQVQQIHMDNEMHRFCSYAASNNILLLIKYMGVSLLINT